MTRADLVKWAMAATIAIVTGAGMVLAAGENVTVFSDINNPIPDETGAALVQQGHLAPSGWALDCATGQRPTEVVMVLRRIGAGSPQFWVPSSISTTLTQRPDVWDAYADQCAASNVSFYLGYVMTLGSQPPVGLWRMYITWNNVDGTNNTKVMAVNVY